MFSQDYSQQSSAHAFPTTNNQLFCNERQREGEEAFKGVGGAVSAPSSTKMVSRQSVSSEHSGDELFCLDDPSADTGGFGFGVARNTHVAGTIHLQSYTESDEEYRCDDEIDRDDFLVHHRELEEAKKYQQQHEKNNVAFDASRRGKTVRDLIERIIEFSTESQISVWEDVLLDLRRKEDDDARFILDVNDARHLQFRVPLVEWILDVCAEAQFGPATADVAVEYMVSESFFLCDLFLCAAHIACTRSSSSSSICSPFFRFILFCSPAKNANFRVFAGKKGKKAQKVEISWSAKKNLGLFLPFFQLLLFFFYKEETHRQNKWRGESFGSEEKEDKNTDSIYSF